MSLTALFQWLEATPISALIRESIWGYPIVAAIHVVGFAWFGGGVLAVNLRVLGSVMEPWPMREVIRQLRAWRGIALGVTLVAGLLLFSAQPARYAGNVSFRLKMLLLVLAGANALILRSLTGGEADREPGTGARRAARLSLALWIGIVFAARGIAYF